MKTRHYLELSFFVPSEIYSHPDDVRDQGQERADFGGRALSPAVIKTLGKKFTDQTSASKLLFHSDGRVYGNKGLSGRGNKRQTTWSLPTTSSIP
jgi:hypothetical protein